VKADLNLASLVSSSNDVDYSYKPSFNAGVLAHIHVTKHFAVQPELMYSGQGAKYTLAGEDGHINLGYINLPVLFQYMFGDGFRLETGPQIGALASAKSKVGDNSVDIKDNLKGVDFSWAVGASYVSPSGFGGDIRYNPGISNINDNRNDDSKIRNSVFSIGAFYQFKEKNH